MVEEGDRYVDFAVKFACVHQQYSAASKIVNHAYEEDHPVARELLQYIKQQAVAASRQEGDMEGVSKSVKIQSNYLAPVGLSTA